MICRVVRCLQEKKKSLTQLPSLYHSIYVFQSKENFLVIWFSDVVLSGTLSFQFEQK